MQVNLFAKTPVPHDSTKLICIGQTGQGQLGINGFGDYDSVMEQPIEICFKLRIKQIACGYEHTHLLTVEGALYSMGSNQYGQLGIGLSPTQIQYTHQPSLLKNHLFKKVQCGTYHSVALDQYNSVFVWGKDDSGAIGPMAKPRFVPRELLCMRDSRI